MAGSETLKLYTYTDETGQHTMGDFFIVVTVIIEKIHREGLKDFLLRIESNSDKNKLKWSSTNFDRRKSYMQHLINIPEDIKPVAYFSQFTDTTQYGYNTGVAISRAVKTELCGEENYGVKILIDGLQGRERDKMRRFMKDENIRYDKIRGRDDENCSIIRLADAVAGFLKDYKEKKGYENKKNILAKLHEDKEIIKKGEKK